MSYQNVFKRYELKFMLTRDEKEILLDAMNGKMKLDSYGRTTIRNIYYDTPDWRLIRNSLEKPVYKEKLRVRSYTQVGQDDKVFVEIKKKFEDVVYKRRIAIPEHQASDWLNGSSGKPFASQIANEIDYFKDLYKGLAPACFLSYEREAFYDIGGSDLRITMDENILARQSALSLTKGVWGKPLLPPGMTLLEIKTSGALPMWLVRYLSSNRIHKVSFSKYGAFYGDYIYPQTTMNYKGGLLYA